MKKPICRPISLRDARSGKRIRVSQFLPGTALVPVCHSMPMLGYWFRQDGGLTVYVAGSMPLDMRTAAEAGSAGEETWLSAVRGGIREIDLTDCRGEFMVQQPTVVRPLFAAEPTLSDAQAA
jgi:hypothetical protein